MYTMGKVDKEPDKWKQPGWRIEQKYGPKVLIGNWAEENLQFTREHQTPSSTHRLDYCPQKDCRPDVIVRREAMRRAEGISLKQLLSHHDTPRAHHLITLYDEMYGRRGNTAPPLLRSWHRDKLAWVPERSDHPLQTPPTNWGLAESRAARCWDVDAVYRSTYPWHPPAVFRPPRSSSALHPAIRLDRGLNLERRPCMQVSDNSGRLLPPLAQV